jgi:hypothetical protein
MKRAKIEIEFDIPPNANPVDVKKYIQHAIEGWSGQFHPDHPLFAWFRVPDRLKLGRIRKVQ